MDNSTSPADRSGNPPKIISLFPCISQTRNGKTIAVDLFLEYVREGKWQDIILPIRAIPDKTERNAKKETVPYVTLSGTYEERKDNQTSNHSGFIGIDIDDVEPEETKSILCADNYVYACFTSISGRGVCAMFRINGEKHREAFAGITEHLYSKYGLVCDPSCANPSRARYVSYDPHLYINEKSPKFTTYPKNTAPKKVEQVVFAQNDFDSLILDLQQRRINLCDDYHTWLRIGFALADKFGESGRNYFHVVSQFSAKYKQIDTDRQYAACLKASGSKVATIATFYYYVKQAGLTLYSPTTSKIISAAVTSRKGGIAAEETVKHLQKFENIAPEISTPIVTQVFENNITHSEDTLIDQVEQWIRINCNLRKNCITRVIENNGIPLSDQYDMNSLFLAAKKIFEKGFSYDLFERICNSKNTPMYNPFIEFIEANKHLKPTGVIDELFNSIETEDPEYARKYGKKWLVSIIAAIYGTHSPLMLILSGGEQGTGKTEWFRRLFPVELQPYYAEISPGIKDNDLNILMSQKLIIMDDECIGKSSKEEGALKSMLSKNTFSLREPYGRTNVDLKRLAVMCGTTNQTNIISDTTGNRRLIPIPVISINHDKYNAIDKTELFMEAYHLYKDGFICEIQKDEIRAMAEKTITFEAHSLEYELINRFYRLPTEEDSRDDRLLYLTASDIKVELEKQTDQRLNLNKIGAELQRLGFEQKSKRIGKNSRKVYVLVKEESCWKQEELHLL